MDRQAAIDVLDLLAAAAAAELCSCVPSGACPRCTVSIGVRLWAAVDTLSVPPWPEPDPTRTEVNGASRS